MDVTLGLLSHSPAGDTGDVTGGGVPSNGSTTARSILTKTKNTNMVMSIEVTSSYPVFDENLGDLELGLGLSIGGLKSKVVAAGGWSQYARILTAKDFPTSKPNSCSSSYSSTSGTKRTATDSVSPPNGTSVVGWPPVSKAHRMPNVANQIKSPTENVISITEQNKRKRRIIGINDYSSEQKLISNKKYQSVKVNLDGTPVGRKVDLNAHTSYEMLASTLEQMFWGKRLSGNSLSSRREATKHSRLLDETSEFVLTYEDKDGDCMLVGDVPWKMFVSSVKRLRIMRNSESNELSRKQQETKN